MKAHHSTAALVMAIASLFLAAPLIASPQTSVLSQARSEAGAGHFDRAVKLFESVLASEPDNTDALSGLVDAQVARGHWRDSLPALERLVELQPRNAERVFQLGQLKSWQGGQRGAALELLRRSTQLDPQNLKYPEYYAQVLSWDESSRPQALSILKDLLDAHPNDNDALLAYAEILSWSQETRPQALESYQKVLAQDPNNGQALAGEAQLLAWEGQSTKALDMYERALRMDPNNVAALRGKAQILGWRGDYAQAKNLLQQAHGLAPGDSATIEALARAEYELGEYGQARQDLSEVDGIGNPDREELERNVDHALGTYVELGYGMRRDGMRLDSDSATALVSTPFGVSNRLGLLYTPMLFRTNQRNFNSNYYSLILDSHLTERATTHAEAGGRTYPGVPSQFEGAFNTAINVRPSFKLTAGFAREADLESLVSTLGASTGGIFVGQVQTNLGSMGGSYSNSQHHYDVSLTYTDGMYTGQNLAANRRWSVDGILGKSIRDSRPYLRAAYGFTYLSFDHDAEFEPGSGAPVRVTGGYFSPTRYLLNYGQLFLSMDLDRRAKWDAGGFVGAQNSETTFTSFSSTQLASTFSTHLTWSVAENGQLRLGYDYLNVFNAFHRHLFLVSWRQYF